MPSPEHEAYRNSLLLWSCHHAQEPDVAPALERFKDALQILWHLDLEPARPILAAGYAPSPRGGKPWDPIAPFRSLLLMLLVGQTAINQWVPDLRGNRVLQRIAGLAGGKVPGVGTFYDFLHRLHDGDRRQDRPSEEERRRAKSPQPKQKVKTKAPPAGKNADEQKPRAGKRRAKKTAGKDDSKAMAAALTQIDGSVTEKLRAQLMAAKDLPNAMDLLNRLGLILLEVAVKPSATLGLLGDTSKIAAGGDGSVLPTGADKDGQRTCKHPPQEHCDCPRIFDDPDARIGLYSHRKKFFYGHRLYEISVSTSGHDLPLAIRLDPANASDFTASMLALDSLYKNLRDHAPNLRLASFNADAGHDAEAIHRFLRSHGTQPVIPLKDPAPAIHPARPDIKLSPRGVPLCQGGVEMASWGSAGEDRKLFRCAFKAGQIDHCPLAPEGHREWVCRPDLKSGPTISINVEQNPRLCPAVSRNSALYQELYDLRTGCERSNSIKKGPFKLEAARHRRASLWLIRLHLIAILQHARVWVMGRPANELLDILLGRQELATAA